MAYNTKSIKTDKDGNPISQYYNPQTDEYEPVEGAGGGNAVILYNEDGTPNNSLSLGEILDKLDQLKGTVIDEETRKQNEQIRQEAENERIQTENERIQAENVRQSNENIRESNEQTRQQNEQIRQEAENERIQAENERIQAENERIQAENTRIQNENERKSNEQIRQQKEDERQQNEITRQTNEQTRQQNEQERIDLYNALKDLDISQYELRLQKLEHDTSVEETVVEEAYGPVIPLPENVVNGQINDIKIEGNTYTNILEDYMSDINNWQTLNGEILDDDFIKATADGTGKAFFLKASIITLKPDTQYTIFVEVRKNTLTGSGLVVTYSNPQDSFGVNNIISPGKTGIFKFLVTTKSDLTNTLPLRMFINSTATSGEIEFRVMFLEGDYTNENISYIRGTKSTLGAIRLKSVGKNIWGSKKAADDVVQTINDSNYAYLTNIDGRNCLAIVGNGLIRNKDIFNKFKPNTQYTIQVYAKRGDSSYSGGYLLIRYTDDSVGRVTPPSDVWSKVVYTSDPGETIKSIELTYSYPDYTNYFDYDTLQIEEGTQATEYEPYKESTLYVIAKDEEGNILELRSLPNGIKDEVNIGERKVIIRTKEVVLNGGENWSIYKVHENTICFQLDIPDKVIGRDNHGYVTGFNYVLSGFDRDRESYSFSILTNCVYINIDKNKLMTNDINGFKEWLSENPVTLIYQLAEPIEVPIEVFGNLQSYENGTVYVDTIISKVNFYDGQEGITVTAPIKTIDTLYKVDKETGYLHPLDISQAVITEDGLSFTHPELADGDLVDWDYIPDVESTNPAISMKLPTNLKASINSNIKRIGELSDKVDNLNTRTVAAHKNIQDLQNESNEHKEEFNRYKQIYVPGNIVSRPMRYIAHRGASAIAPENTIAAYELAGQLGFWGVEADAIVTKDGVWVALHDTNVERMTNGSGNIQEMTFAEVQNLKIDAGANVNYYPDQKIPTIEEFLNICVKWELVPIIEVKGNMDIENAQSLIELIQSKGLIGKVIISSLQLSHLTTIREINKEVFVEYATHFNSSTIDIIKSLGNAMLSLDYRNVNESVAKQCGQNNIILSSYTINDYNIAKSLEKLGVAQIYSDILC